MKKTLLIIISCVSVIHISAQNAYTLEQVLDSARANNIALKKGQHNVDAAHEQRKEAFTKYFPSVSATGAWFNANKSMAQTDVDLSEYITPELAASLSQMLPAETLAALSGPMTISMMKNGVIASVNAIQPVFAGGQIVNGNKLAKIGEEVSQLQLRLTENEVEKTAEQYFWQIVTLEEKLRTVAAVEAMLSDIHKDVSLSLQAGLILRNDLLQVELRQNEVESQKAKLQNALSLVRMLLTQYCGFNNTHFTLQYVLEAQSPLLFKHDHQQALYSTPEYLLLDKQVEAATLQKKIAVGENLPTVAVGAGYNYHNLLENDRTFGMLFATVNIPISNWWGGSHHIKRKKIAQQQAIEQRADNAELLSIRMQKAWNDVEEAYQQLTIADRSIQQAEENLRINRNCYRSGTITMSNLLEAQMLYQQSLDKRTDAFADYQNKLLAYQHALGM